jgi:hypothetical protein
MDVPVYNDGCSLPSGGNGSRRDGSGNDEGGLLLAGYAPGMNQAIWPSGTVKKIPVGSKIVFQLHYSKVAGAVQKDRSTLGLIFAKAPVEKNFTQAGRERLFPDSARRRKPQDVGLLDGAG